MARKIDRKSAKKLLLPLFPAQLGMCKMAWLADARFAVTRRDTEPW